MTSRFDVDTIAAGRIIGLILVVIVTSISAWLAARQMRKRIKRAIKKDVSDIELTSINTWMEVESEEEYEAKDGFKKQD